MVLSTTLGCRNGNHGKNINTCYITGDNWRRISSINSIKRACNWDTEPKLSPMPSWFRKWRQRMYSVSSIPKDLKAERRTLEFCIMQLVAGQWFSPRRIKTTPIKSNTWLPDPQYISSKMNQNDISGRLSDFDVSLLFGACSVPQISSVMVSSKVNSLGDPLLIGLEPDPWETSASETFCNFTFAIFWSQVVTLMYSSWCIGSFYFIVFL